MIRHKLILCLCLSGLCLQAQSFAQEQPAQNPQATPPAKPAPPQQPPAQPPATELPATPQQQNAPEPPPPPPTPSPYNTADGHFSIAPFYWINTAHPKMRTGKAAAPGANPSDLDYPGKNKKTPGLILTFPAGPTNALHISYFRTQGSGSLRAGKALNIFGADYNPGDLLSPRYTLQNVKVSFDYLSWPFPLKDSRFRLKTLWEVQYTSIQTTIAAPELEAANPSLSPTKKSNWFVYPTIGLGITESLSKDFRIEMKASGFAFPHRAAIGDGEALAAYRMGAIEIFAGAKGFYFKTSPKREEYVRAILYGGFVGIRWYPKF